MTKKKEPVKAPVKKAPEKKAPVTKKETVKIPKIIKPVIIETISAGEKVSDMPAFEKRVYTSLPTSPAPGEVRVIVLKDYKGMLNDLYEGDIIDLPERRYKSLAFRGLVKLYEGNNQPNKQR
jgi:hypothetical protein